MTEIQAEEGISEQSLEGLSEEKSEGTIDQHTELTTSEAIQRDLALDETSVLDNSDGQKRSVENKRAPLSTISQSQQEKISASSELTGLTSAAESESENENKGNSQPLPQEINQNDENDDIIELLDWSWYN